MLTLDETVKEKIEEKASANRADGMGYFTAYYDAFGGNDAGPLLDPFDGVRLLFINAFAKIRLNQGEDDEKIDFGSLRRITMRVLNGMSPELFSGSDNDTLTAIRNTIEYIQDGGEKPKIIPQVPTSLKYAEHAEQALASIDNEITQNFMITKTALFGMLANGSTMTEALSNAKKGAAFDLDNFVFYMKWLCETAVKAHKITSTAATIVYAAGDVVGVDTHYLYFEMSSLDEVAETTAETLDEMTLFPKVPQAIKKELHALAHDLRSMQYKFELGDEIRKLIADDISKNEFNFVCYLGGAFVYRTNTQFKEQISAEYESRASRLDAEYNAKIAELEGE